MSKLLRAGILIVFGMLIICINNGCSDDDPIETGEIRLLSTVPEDGGIVSPTGKLTIIFDSFPKFVYVDGKLALIQDNTAIVKVADLPNLIPGTDNTITIEWRNQENFLVGSETITVTVLKPVTVVVDPASRTIAYFNRGVELKLQFSDEVMSVEVNGRSATGSGLDWRVDSDHVPYGKAEFLTIEWINRDGSKGYSTVGPYAVVYNSGEPPVITSGTVWHGDVDVDPALINAGGLRYDFDEPITGTIKLTDEAGVDLNWIGNVVGQTATLTAVAGQEMVNETTYRIEIDVKDGAGNKTQATINFVTKPK